MLLSVLFLAAILRVEGGEARRPLLQHSSYIQPTVKAPLHEPSGYKHPTIPKRQWILITGVNGIIGNRLIQQLTATYDIILMKLENMGFPLDVEKEHKCLKSDLVSLSLDGGKEKLIEELRGFTAEIAFVLDAAAREDDPVMGFNVRPGDCQKSNPLCSYKPSHDPRILEEVASVFKAIFIYFSTNYIFTGSSQHDPKWPAKTITELIAQGIVKESSSTTTYADVKRSAEKSLKGPKTIILRFPGMYTKDHLTDRTAFDHILKMYHRVVPRSYENSEGVTYYTNTCHKMCPTKAENVAKFVEGLMTSLNSDICNTEYHIYFEKQCKRNQSQNISIVHYRSLHCQHVLELLKEYENALPVPMKKKDRLENVTVEDDCIGPHKVLPDDDEIEVHLHGNLTVQDAQNRDFLEFRNLLWSLHDQYYPHRD